MTATLPAGPEVARRARRVLGRGALADALRAAVLDGGGPPLLLTVDRSDVDEGRSETARVAHLPLRTRADSVEIGPLLAPGGRGCSSCADARHRAALSAGGQDLAAVTDPRHADPPPHLLPLVVEVALELAAGPSRTCAVVALNPVSVTRHVVTPVPHCPRCGQEPADGPAVVRLHPRPTAEPHRLRASALPVASRLRRALVDPRTGAVTRLYRDQLSPLSLAVADLAPLTGTSEIAGYGRSAGAAGAATVALLEAVERDTGATATGRRTITTGSYAEVAADAIDPARLGLHDPDLAGHGGHRPVPYTPDVVTRWVWGWSFGQARPVLVPEHVAYWGAATGPGAARFITESSNGCAVGGTYEEALLHGCLEVLERDAFLLAWYGRQRRTRLDADGLDDPMVDHLLDRVAAEGYDVRLYDITSDVGVPTVWALAVTHDPGRPASFTAAGAHVDPRRAAVAALLEVLTTVVLASHRPSPDPARLRAMLEDPHRVQTLEDHVDLYTLPAALPRLDFLLDDPAPSVGWAERFGDWRARWVRPDLTDTLRLVLDRMIVCGIEPVAVEQTGLREQELGLAAVKVVAPGAVPMTFGHANRRVRGLPRLDRAREHRPPLHPHPFP